MNKYKISVIGLGYVGLPLAVEFAKKFPVVGFDINDGRINELNQGVDSTLEVENENLQSVLGLSGTGLLCTSDLDAIADCNVHIITATRLFSSSSSSAASASSLAAPNPR